MIPKNPITIAINGWLFSQTFKKFMADYLPNYTWIKTSGYRTEEQNRRAGGAADSAHMYALAEDGVLKNRTTGSILTDNQMAEVYKEFIKPYWPGYSEFNFKTPKTNTGWIHLNIDRDVSKTAAWIGAAGLVGAAAYLFRNQLKKVRSN